MSLAMRSRFDWTVLAPIAGAVVLAVSWGHHPGPVPATVIAIFLVMTVLAAVHHAEVVAHRVGEPFGSLLLAVAVTVIEVALIVTLMITGSGDTSALARDTVFAAVMITLNGIAGLALLVGALKHHLAVFNPEGAGSALTTVVALATLTLVLPRFTTSTPARSSPAASWHSPRWRRSWSTGCSSSPRPSGTATSSWRSRPAASRRCTPTHRRRRRRCAASGLLVLALVGVVGLAKVESYPIEDLVSAAGFPHSFVGVIIALLVLLPESIAAVRAASRNHVQISLNLAYGSAMASIGLTIPAIAVASIWLDGPLVLGLEPTQMVLLTVSVFVAVLTVVPGRAKSLHGGVHLALLAAYVFLAINP